MAAPTYNYQQQIVDESGNVLGTSTHPLQVGTPGASAAGASLVSSTAAEASHVLKNAAGTLISIVGYNGKTATQFIQVHNTASLPADASVPIYSFAVAPSSNFSLDVPITGIPFSTGITVCNSSTLATKTIGSADCWFTAVVI